MDEQDFLSKIKSVWIVELKASFQEGDYLYLVMEFLQGGDLMGLFIARDTLKEEEAKFYICELILALDNIHDLNSIHRDLKPDNILIDKSGHIKLTDFGLAKISQNVFKEDIINYEYKENNRHTRNFSCVGTAYYVAPEVLTKTGSGPEIDWWSLGVIFFEMLYGYAPFCSKKTQDVCYKVTHFEKYFKFPNKKGISDVAKDLINKLIKNPSERLGKNGSIEIKNHPFFKGINWSKIREMKPPFIPELENEYDCKYFDTIQKIDDFYPDKSKTLRKRKEPEYTGYQFNGRLEDPYDTVFIINLIEKYKMKLLKKDSSLGSLESKNTQKDSQSGSNKRESIDQIKSRKNTKTFLIQKPLNNTINNIFEGTHSLKHNFNNIILTEPNKDENNQKEKEKLETKRTEKEKPTLTKKKPILIKVGNKLKMGLRKMFAFSVGKKRNKKVD